VKGEEGECWVLLYILKKRGGGTKRKRDGKIGKKIGPGREVVACTGKETGG